MAGAFLCPFAGCQSLCTYRRVFDRNGKLFAPKAPKYDSNRLALVTILQVRPPGREKLEKPLTGVLYGLECFGFTVHLDQAKNKGLHWWMDSKKPPGQKSPLKNSPSFKPRIIKIT